MFSSLSAIQEAEYTFDTTFQDQQYKVVTSLAAIFKSLKLHQGVFLDMCINVIQCVLLLKHLLLPAGVHEATPTRHRVSAVSGKKLRGV